MQELLLTSDHQSDEVFEVEAIKGVREVDSGLEYYVKWKGYPDTENTWEPEENLNCAEAIEKYYREIRIQAIRQFVIT